jgi:hypothetical protein
MDKIAKYIGLPLQWRKPHLFGGQYELLCEDAVVATLQFRSLWGTRATGQSGDGCWTFKRVGFWQTRATIRPCDSDQEMAAFKNSTWSGGGTLLLPDGRQYPANTNFWQTQYEFTTETGDALIHYRNRGLLGSAADVTISPQAREVAELPWMVMLGWYLVIMMQQDSSAAAAT